jgi:hypothetical protein
LITCKTVTSAGTVRHRKVRVKRVKCTGRLVSGPVKFTTNATRNQATLSRRGCVYATGTRLTLGVGDSVLVVSESRALPRGRYTLTARGRRGRRWITRREAITLS